MQTLPIVVALEIVTLALGSKAAAVAEAEAGAAPSKSAKQE